MAEDWKKSAISVTPVNQGQSWKDSAIKVSAPVKEEPYYNPVEKAGIAGLKALLSIPGVTPALQGYEKYVTSPIRRTVQEGPVEAVKKIGEEAPSFREKGLGIQSLSGKKTSEAAPSLFSEKPEEYSKPFVWKKGGVFDFSARDVAGTLADLIADPSSYFGIGTAQKAVTTAGKEGLELAGKAALKATKTGVEALPKTATAVAKGVAEGVSEAAGAIGKAFNTKVDPYAEKAIKVASEHGLNPADVINPNIEFGHKSTAAKNYRALMQSPGGDEMIAKFENGRKQISDAVNNQVSKIAGTQNFPVSAEDAGRVLKDSYKTSVDAFFKQRDVTYNTVQKMLPELNQVGLTPNQLKSVQTKLNGIRRVGAGLEKMGGTSGLQEQGKILQNFSNTMQSQLANKSYKQLVRDLRQIGDFAYGDHGMHAPSPTVVKAYKDVYSSLSNALVNTVDEIGRQPGREVANTLGKSLKENNTAFHEFFGKQKFIDDILTNERLGGERMTQAFLNGDTKLLDDFLSIVKDEQTKKQLAGYLIDNALRDKDGIIQFASSRSKILNSDRLQRTLSRLISPEELKNLDNVLELGEKYGIDLLNPSGTGEYLKYGNLKESLVNRPVQKGYQKFLESSARKGAPVNPIEMQPTSNQPIRDLLNIQAKKPSGLLELLGKTPVSVPMNILNQNRGNK